ncbi:hypothetical protein J2X45_001731 [Caulobacter sp. BE264]|uniref:hypothetical protein n=1 Tax=Caulobacter sp. BE264 TaxID=2817724 RepID=UPI002859AF03|nr:hypothetical protein [Caulobacter sp. BE264]MDR7230640.1 hypothetical protein [Caulobacter sp. BE264]
MPQAALAAAVWVGSQVAFAAAAVGASTVVAAATGYATIGATLAAEVYAVSKATQALTPKIKGPETVLQWQADPRAGIPYGIGRSAIAGSIVFNQAAGDTNKFLNFATVYSGAGPIDGFEAFQANGVTVPFTADGGEGASGYYLNRMWLKTQLGQANEPYLHWTATGSKDTPANHGGMPSEWTSAHKLSGLAASLWALEYDPKKYASGVPSPRMIGRWVKTYDPRQDSTYPGGSGAHRWNDESTWTWSRCPYRNAITWIIGRRSGGVLTHGLGADISEIDVPAFVQGANVSDANSWYVDGAVDSLDDDYEVLKAMLQAGAGVPILGGSKISCMVNAPAVSLATITEADIVGTMTVPGQVSAAERINTVWPSYTEEALDWQVVTPDAPVQVAEYVAVDGEERSIELGMPLITSATQVGQICRYAIEDARELTGIVLTLFPRWKWLPPGACVTVNSPEAGLNGQKVRIQKRTRDLSTKLPTYICRTETDGKHAYALGQTNTPPADPALTGVDPTVVPLPGDGAWQIVDGVVANDDGSLPAIVIRGAADYYNAVTIVVDFREILGPVGGPNTFGEWQSQSFPATATELVVTGVKPGSRYQVRVRYITAAGTENPDTGTDLGNVTTGPIVSAGVKTIAGMTPSALVDELRANTDAGRQLAQANLELAMGAIDERGQLISETFHKGVRVKRILIDEDQEWEEGDKTFWSRMGLMALLSPSGNSMIMRHDTLMWSTTESLADHVEAIRTQIGTDIAAFNTQIRTWVNSSSAGVLWINALEANFGNNFRGSITQTASVVSGMGASYTISTDVNGHAAGLRLVNTGATSAFVVSAAEIGFSNGSTTLYPLAIVGGIVKATNFEADRVRANSIYAVNIVAENIQTTHIAGRNVTDSVVSSSGVSIDLAVGVWTTLRSISYYSLGGRLEIYTQATLGSYSTDSYADLRVLVDGVVQDDWPKYVKGGAYDRIPSLTDATPGAGWHTIEFQATLLSGSGTCRAANYSARITEHKTER